ncbi:hypothetical protein ACLOJK_022686 [Asimina triloba]
MAEPHFLVLTFPGQGHINPAIQFAKRLVLAGAIVTFATPTHAHRRMQQSKDVERLTYASFSDGFDDSPDDDPKEDLSKYMEKFNEIGPQSVSNLIRSLAQQGPPVTCVVYTILLPWAADSARAMGIPSLLLWIQPAALFAIYYHYFHGYEEIIKSKQASFALVEFPGLPPFPTKDLPSFFQPTNNYPFIFSCLGKIFQVLDKESKPKVFANTFEALEADVMGAVRHLELMGVGPLIPLAFLGGRETADKSIGGDLHKCSRDYLEWLDSKPNSSVIYVSFGSFSVLPENQMVEILNGVLASCHPFLWVIRNSEEGQSSAEFWKNIRDAEAAKQGLVVPWCSQVEVLSHPSVGCFVTHCGWNSTLESLAVGVPMVGFPQWTDQPTNMKLVESVWKAGVRAKVNEEGVLEGGELRRCLDLVIGDGEEGEEMRRNAAKWRDSAREAAGEGGSSEENIRALVEETRKRVAAAACGSQESKAR